MELYDQPTCCNSHKNDRIKCGNLDKSIINEILTNHKKKK